MRALIPFIAIITCFQTAMSQRMLSFKPQHPVICRQSFENRHDHVGVSDKSRKSRQNASGRVKTANFEVQYINFPADNFAKTAFQFAVEIWESELITPIPVKIVAEWRPLDAGVLGQALWGRAYANFGGEQHMNTFYPVALAEKISGRELNDATEADIVATFNSNTSWYFGTDGNTPAGKMDLVTIVLHEIAHGLGFTDTYGVEDTGGSVGLENGGTTVPFIFDVFVENQASENLLNDFQSPSAPLRDALQSTNLFFNSPLSVASLSGTRPELFAPSTFDEGSSISHLDETVFSSNGDANRLMTPHIDFAESIHDPGSVLLGMLGDMGWIHTNIDHVPLKDTERNDGQPYPVTATIASDNGYDGGQVKLHYTSDGVNFTVLIMTPTGTANQFQSSIPGTSVNMAYAYFISVVDGTNRTFTSPGKVQEIGEQLEQGTHFFSIGPDVTDPEITHEPVAFIFETDNDLNLRAEVTDNLGVKEVLVEYSVNGGAFQTQVMAIVAGSDQYTAIVVLLALAVGDDIQYRIVARDLASVENVAFHPATGFHLVTVNGILPVQDSYVNNFDELSSDFFGNSFSITTPQGFANGAIHSDHPYNNGSGVDDESNYSYQLQIPIRISDENPLISFDEIVLVEPGETGSEFGDPDFFDYVVVEGSADGGNNWKPFAAGYDSRDKSVWLDRYSEEIVDDNSESVGDPALYRTRVISMIEGQDFAAGDEVLVRFRLFADALAHGWGWAIDNLSIQGSVTGVEEDPFTALKVYPVPVHSELVVELSTSSGHSVEIQIADVQGRVVYTEEVAVLSGSTFQKTISAEKFSEGIYILKATSGNRIFARKFVRVNR
ncbi:MAG: T9SS type A sorting domain-containing protein [Cyclobacteriaceae bacterium]